MTRCGWFVLLGLMVAASAGQAEAQYYPGPPPPPGYGPRPYYPPPRRALGGRCDAFLPTAYGPRREICRLVALRPLGAPCHCPAPPRFRRGWLGGRVIR